MPLSLVVVLVALLVGHPAQAQLPHLGLEMEPGRIQPALQIEGILLPRSGSLSDLSMGMEGRSLLPLTQPVRGTWGECRSWAGLQDFGDCLLPEPQFFYLLSPAPPQRVAVWHLDALEDSHGPSLVAGGIVGGVLGIVAGVAAVATAVQFFHCDHRCVILGAILGESLGVATGVHLADGGEGSFPRRALTSTAIGLGGAAVGLHVAPTLLLVPVVQLWVLAGGRVGGAP